ncbi:MAG: hypothetical protein HWE11_16570 [Gammaproteobacteria bacterium]|nr:hypothetical protein [Gammaproteobacteria bacterium]
MTSDLSPYQTPNSEIDENTAQANAEIIINQVPLSRGAYWFFDGFKRFFRNPFAWLTIGLINFLLLLVVMVVAIIPIIGSFVPTLLYPVIVAGFMKAAANQDQQSINISDLFFGFQHQTSQLFINGALYLAMTIGAGIITIIIMLILGFGMFSAIDRANDASVILWILLLFLVFMALWLPVMMAVWFAPALIALRDQEGVKAIALSFKGCWRNFWPYFIYGLTAMAVMLGVGFLVFFIVFLVSGGGNFNSLSGSSETMFIWIVSILSIFATLAGGPIFFASVYSSYIDIYQSAEHQ